MIMRYSNMRNSNSRHSNIQNPNSRYFNIHYSDKHSINAALLFILSFMPAVTIIFASNAMIYKFSLLAELALLLIMGAANYPCITKKEAFTVMLNLLSLTITLSLHSAFGNAIIYINTLICFKVFNNISVNRRTYLSFHLINGILLSIYVFSIHRPVYVGNMIPDAFGNMINTNLISLITYGAFLHISCVIVKTVRKKKRRRRLFLAAGFLYGEVIWFYNSRSAIISMIIFAVIITAAKKSIPYLLYKKTCTVLMTAALLFPFIYVTFIRTIGSSVLFGKNISTRSVVWLNCIHLILRYPVFGNGNDIMVRLDSGNLSVSMHNTLLSLWKILGVIPAVTFITHCIQHRESKEYDDKRDFFAQAAFISTIFSCFFESFYTEQLLYMIFLPFLITNVKDEGILEKSYSLLLVRKKSKTCTYNEMYKKLGKILS